MFKPDAEPSPNSSPSPRPSPRPSGVQVVVIFSPVDFKDLDHVSFECGKVPFQRREYVSQQTCLPDGSMFIGPSSMEFLIRSPDRTVSSFIGSALLHETFNIWDKDRPKLIYGTDEWEMECWYWNAYQLPQDKEDQGDDQDDDDGLRFSRDCMISDIPQVTYRSQEGHILRGARVLVLRRDCVHVQHITGPQGKYYIQCFGHARDEPDDPAGGGRRFAPTRDLGLRVVGLSAYVRAFRLCR